MNTPVPQTDLKALWQEIESEKTTMSVQQMSVKAGKFLKKSRRDLIARSAFGVVSAVFCGVVMMSARTSIAVIAGLVMAMLVGGAVRNVIVFYRRSVAAPTAGDASSTSCLAFYRTELERQRDMAKQPAWQFVVALFIVAWLARRGIATGHDSLSLLIPIVLLAAGGLVVLMAVRKIEARRVERDLEALDVFQGNNPSGGGNDASSFG